MPKIVHYRKKCIGCNACVQQCPDYWEMDETDGKVNLKRSKEKNGVHVLEVFDEELDMNQAASDYCPVNIIRLMK